MTSLGRRVHYRSMDGFYKRGMLFFSCFLGGLVCNNFFLQRRQRSRQYVDRGPEAPIAKTIRVYEFVTHALTRAASA